MTGFRFFLAIGLAAGGLVHGPIALAQSKPTTPANFCVQDSAGKCPAVTTTASNAIKWHPGHYVRANTTGSPEKTSARFEVYDRIKNNANFKGGIINVPWGAIETSKDVYDFSVIDQDLAHLKGMGKRLIIEVWTTQYGGSVVGTGYFPQYIQDEGGIVNIRNSGCCTVDFSKPYWMDRYIKLIQKLGARYNSDPYVEQLQTNETSVTPSDEYKRLIEPMAKAWPNTVTVLMMNFASSAQSARDLVALAAKFGVGIGAPDILPPAPLSPYGEDQGSLVARGAGNVTDYQGNVENYGTIDYRDVIPLSYQYQGLMQITPAILIDHALNTMRMTHIGWMVADMPNYTGDPLSMLWSTGVLPVVNSVSGRINTKCPSVYAGRCSTN